MFWIIDGPDKPPIRIYSSARNCVLGCLTAISCVGVDAEQTTATAEADGGPTDSGTAGPWVEATGTSTEEATSSGSPDDAQDGGTATGGMSTTESGDDEPGESVGDESGNDGGVDLVSVCLSLRERSLIVLNEAYDGEHEHTIEAPGIGFDMRGASFAYDFIGTTGALSLDGVLDDVCVVGVEIRGTQDPLLDWADVKNTDGVRYIHRADGVAGHMRAEGIWVENVGDAFEPARYSGAAGQGYSWTLAHSYFRHIRDDVIENDACHAGRVEDVLVDDSFVFLSTRPGSDNHLDNGDTAPVIEVVDSLIHTGTESLGGRPFKWPGSSSSCTPSPVLDVRNTILRVDQAGGNLTFPEGSYENVTMVWLGGGDYPEPVPDGVTVTDDLGVWLDARAAWLDLHECDAEVTVCDRLVDAP